MLRFQNDTTLVADVSRKNNCYDVSFLAPVVLQLPTNILANKFFSVQKKISSCHERAAKSNPWGYHGLFKISTEVCDDNHKVVDHKIGLKKARRTKLELFAAQDEIPFKYM